jgi:hypothetical protein
MSSDQEWAAKLDFECSFSRFTATVRVTRQEEHRGRNWAWMQFILPLHSDGEWAWESYKMQHSGNTTRMKESDLELLWKASQGQWLGSSAVTSADGRTRTDGRVTCYHWKGSDVNSRKKKSEFNAKRGSICEYKRRSNARIAEREHELNTKAFGSNTRQDWYRALVLRAGKQIEEGADGALFIKGGRKEVPVYYGVSVPAPPPSRKRNPLPIEAPVYEWIIISNPDEPVPIYDTTSVDPGPMVSLPLARDTHFRQPLSCPRIILLLITGHSLFPYVAGCWSTSQREVQHWTTVQVAPAQHCN